VPNPVAPTGVPIADRTADRTMLSIRKTYAKRRCGLEAAIPDGRPHT
jgi:hypothetical protein